MFYLINLIFFIFKIGGNIYYTIMIQIYILLNQPNFFLFFYIQNRSENILYTSNKFCFYKQHIVFLSALSVLWSALSNTLLKNASHQYDFHRKFPI
jgi:hypothetical protein